MNSPNFCVLKTDGINCDMEMAYALETAGASPAVVHVNQLRAGEANLRDYAGLVIPGGFSYGDDLGSGRVLGNELTSYLSDQLGEFVAAERPVVGVCNGFQVLVATGLLPSGQPGQRQVSLRSNEQGRFECRWIDLKVGQTVCKFTQSEELAGMAIPMQTAHGEGRFRASEATMQRLGSNGQIAFRYVRPDGTAANGFPYNPNGSQDDIAGICDPTGTVLGMMPHPERSIAAMHPHRARSHAAQHAAYIIFQNIVNYTKEQ